MKFQLFNSCNNFLKNENDSDANIFSENLQNLNTPYILPQESNAIFQKSKTDSFSVLHVNIRSLNKKFEKLKLMLSKLTFSFKIICLTETWCTNEHFANNSNYQLHNYSAITSRGQLQLQESNYIKNKKTVMYVVYS